MEYRRGMSLPKDPLAVVDYEFRWTDWLTNGELIISQSVVAESGLAVDVSAIENAGRSVRAWFSGGTDGAKYGVTCTVTTDSTPARTQIRTLYIEVADQ